MQSNVPMVKLGEVLTHRGEFITVDDLQTYKRVTAQLHAKGIILRDEVEGVLLKTKKQRVCKAGDFIVAEIDAKVGGFGIVPSDLEGSIVSSHYFLFDIDRTKLAREYLDFFIRTEDFQNQISARGSTNYAAIRPPDVLLLETPLPPLSEQLRIVATLELLTGKIEETRKKREKVLDEIDILRKKSIEAFFQHLTEVTENKYQLKNIGRIFGGGTPSKHNYSYWNGNIPWISPKDMKCSDLFDSEDHITENAIKNSSTSLAPSNSVLLVVRSGILARTVPVAINRIPVTINQDMKVIVPNNEISPEYLRWWIRGMENNILKMVEQGTTVHRILWDKVKDMIIPVPQLSEQRRIVAHLDRLQAKVDEVKRLQAATEREMVALVPAVLAKAFGGAMLS